MSLVKYGTSLSNIDVIPVWGYDEEVTDIISATGEAGADRRVYWLVERYYSVCTNLQDHRNNIICSITV